MYVILVTLKTVDGDKQNIALLSKLIDQHMIFALQFKDIMQLAVYRAGKALISEGKPIDDWKLNLIGLDLGVVWENIIAQVGGFDLAEGKSLDEMIITKEHREKLVKQITALEKRAMEERQPRRKWELAEKVRQLKNQLEGEMQNE